MPSAGGDNNHKHCKHLIIKPEHCSVSTHSSQQVHLTAAPHSHLLAHISMTTEGTCHPDKQTEGGDRGLCLESVSKADMRALIYQRGADQNVGNCQHLSSQHDFDVTRIRSHVKS